MSVLRSFLAPLPQFMLNAEGGAGAGGAGAGAAGGTGGAAAAPGAGAGGAAGAGAGTGGAGGGAAGGGAAAAGAGAGGAAGGAGAAGGVGADPAGVTLAGGGAVDPAAAAAAAAAAAKPAAFAWPEGWRDQLAEQLKPGDKNFRLRLERLASPTDVAKAWLGLEGRLSSGELKAVAKAPENATPEQLAAWRKEQGLPVDAASYVTGLKLKDGVVPGEADAPLLAAVGNLALERGIPQETVNDFVGLFYDLQNSLQSQQPVLDGEFKQSSMQTLIQELGADFKPTLNVVGALWKEHGTPELESTILTARTPDGRKIGDIPEVFKFLGKLGRELNPAAAILPSSSGFDTKAISTRKAEIEGMMYVDGKQNPAYYGNVAIQQEYRDLIDAEAKLISRGKAA